MADLVVRTADDRLLTLASARAALAAATDVAAIATLIDRLEVVRLAARKAHQSLEAQNDWATLKLEAARQAGTLLAAMREAGDLRAGRPNADSVSALDGLGISQQQSSRWQRMAAVPSDRFTRWLAQVREDGGEITEVGLFVLAAEAVPSQTGRIWAASDSPDAAVPPDHQEAPDAATRDYYDPTLSLLVGDARERLRELPERSIQSVITSPPYFGLRDYGVAGQIGSEDSHEAYTASLVAVFREARRVLRDDGTLWINLGDGYGPDKSLLGLPWRVAFALQADGWQLRADIVWAKKNPMPESVKDRPTRAHEFIFLFAKSSRYFYDAEAIKESTVGSVRGGSQAATRRGDLAKRVGVDERAAIEGRGLAMIRNLPTRNCRDVWTISTRPFAGAHFATFPPALVEPCLLAGTSERGQCSECGTPWVRELGRVGVPRNERRTHSTTEHRQGKSPAPEPVAGGGTTAITWTDGWVAGCGHEVEPVPQTVLDPFGGAGTTALVANGHGRRAVLVELNPAYSALALRRLGRGGP